MKVTRAPLVRSSTRLLPLLAALALPWFATGCAEMLDRFSPVAAPRAGVTVDAPAAPTSATIDGPATGPGGTPPRPGDRPAADGGLSHAVVVTGRLVDGVSGLPVRDAGVALLGLDRRTITGPDGGFRFDGVPAGALTLVLGPAEGHVPRGAHAHVDPGAGDLGVVPLLPASPPTLVVPEYGARIEGCEDTDLTIASDALAEPVAIRVTCLERERQFPAPPPAGRLPLFVLDLSPGALETLGAGRLRVRLPAQPRYVRGVSLDLLRLDLERLIWIPTAALEVDPGGHTASGRLDALGTYMVAAPPFGTFGTDVGAPLIGQLRVAARSDGAPVDLWPATTVLVYAVFDYAGMANTPVTVQTAAEEAGVLFEVTRPYADQGRDAVPMVHPNGVWPPGRYVTSIAVGEPPLTAHEVAWTVTDKPTTVPATDTLPVPSGVSGVAPGLASPPPAACPHPLGWYTYVVQPGDTLSSLAARTGATVAALLRANCRERTALFAGELLYLPRPPARRFEPGSPWDASTPVPVRTATAFSRRVSATPVVPSASPGVPPPGPTTWYTPPATVPRPAKPSPVPVTAAPRPTHASPPPTPLPPEPLPTPPEPLPTPPPPELTPPSASGEAPTPKWPTLPPETTTP